MKLWLIIAVLCISGCSIPHKVIMIEQKPQYTHSELARKTLNAFINSGQVSNAKEFGEIIDIWVEGWKGEGVEDYINYIYKCVEPIYYKAWFEKYIACFLREHNASKCVECGKEWGSGL